MKKDVSILIVHFNTPRLLRQTLKGIFRSVFNVSFEVIVVDNNPLMRIADMVQAEFPQARLLVSDHNLGFGNGMNVAMHSAVGRYLFVFNPDMIMMDHALDTLVEFMDQHSDVGMCAPRLLNPDKSLQYSCYRFMKPELIFYRRLPLLGRCAFAIRAMDLYLMKDTDHSQTFDVDYVLGAAMLVRRQAYEQVGGFDSNFFVYFEDQDWCRRFWKSGWRVVYHPRAEILHYHRRETAEGGFFKQIFNPLTRTQTKSAIYYYQKYWSEVNPRKKKIFF